MNVMRLTWIIRCLLSALPIAAVAAVESPGDPDLPQPFDATTLDPLVQNSPFTRAVNLSDSLVLSGLAYIDKKPVATIINIETKQSHVVSEQVNRSGWKLIEATATTDLNRAQVKVSIGGEIVVIRYDKEALSPENLRKKSSTSGSGGPPGGPPGEGDRFRRSGSRGPSDEDRQRYESLSEQAKDKFRNFMRENMDRLRNAGTDEERRQFVRSAFDKIEKEDKGR